MDRLEHNLRLMKENMESIRGDSKKISSALIGNEYTGGVGIVHRMKDLENRTNKSEDKIEILIDNMKLVKWFGSGAGAILLAMIIWYLQK